MNYRMIQVINKFRKSFPFKIGTDMEISNLKKVKKLKTVKSK